MRISNFKKNHPKQVGIQSLFEKIYLFKAICFYFNFLYQLSFVYFICYLYEFPRASIHIEGQLIDCSPRSHGIRVFLLNLICNVYKINKYYRLKIWRVLFENQHIHQLNAWISQRCLKQAKVHSVAWKKSDCFMIQGISNKTVRKYILHSMYRLGNKGS